MMLRYAHATDPRLVRALSARWVRRRTRLLPRQRLHRMLPVLGLPVMGLARLRLLGLAREGWVGWGWVGCGCACWGWPAKGWVGWGWVGCS